jgi:hypothetical protein
MSELGTNTDTNADAAAAEYGLRLGRPDLKSIGPIAFGPDGILFAADSTGASVFAIHIGETTESAPVNLDNVDTRLAGYLGCPSEDVAIRGLAVHPTSHEVFLSIMRGTGAEAAPVIVRLDSTGTLAEVPLDEALFSRTTIEDAPAEDDDRADIRVIPDNEGGEILEVGNGIRLHITRSPLRSTTVTKLAYLDGLLLVAGSSNEEFSSTFRRIPFPFGGEGGENGESSENSKSVANPLEIFHVSHGKYETASPIRAFVPYGGNASILASYTCTPVVHFSLTDLLSGTQARGRTVAELGPMNTPLDMVSYERDGQEYLLVSNSRHPLFKMACSDIDKQEPLDTPHEPLGVPRQELPHPGVGLMANWNGSHVVMLQRDDAASLHLRSYDTASL